MIIIKLYHENDLEIEIIKSNEGFILDVTCSDMGGRASTRSKTFTVEQYLDLVTDMLAPILADDNIVNSAMLSLNDKLIKAYECVDPKRRRDT